MSKPSISVLILDLDNTLFDWVAIWHASFSAMLDGLVRITGVSRDTLIPEIKEIHARHGTSEYAFVIQEIPSIQGMYPGQDLAEVCSAAISAYREARAKVLQLYPSVAETLQTIKDSGTVLVGYTESMAFYANYRMRTLGLDLLLDYLYTSPDHDLPTNLTPEQRARYPESAYFLERTEHRWTPKGQLKPNARVLLKIISDLNVPKSDCAYVGDNLMKDVAMANDAGVSSVHARYGEAHQSPDYDLLKAVTHWPPPVVAAEQAHPRGNARYTLSHSFSEILNYFVFVGPVSLGASLADQIDVWKSVVKVQKHFNELILKLRTFALTALGALLTAAAFAAKDHATVTVVALHILWAAPIGVIAAIVFLIALKKRTRQWVLAAVSLFIATMVALRFSLLSIPEVRISAAAPILIVAALTWSAFYAMDHLWYHRLLKAAVDQGQKLERTIGKQIEGIGLTTEISRQSPFKVFGIPVRSGDKIFLFYFVGLMLVAALFLASFFVEVRGGEGAQPSSAGPRAGVTGSNTSVGLTPLPERWRLV